jgi:Aldo/keto reductase family
MKVQTLPLFRIVLSRTERQGTLPTLQSLKHLGTKYLDLMLLHYPECWGTLCEGTPPEGTWQDSWRAFEHAVDQGKLRAIGEHMSICRSRNSCRGEGQE